MIKLKSVTKPVLSRGLEAASPPAESLASKKSSGDAGQASEASRSLNVLAVAGKGEPIARRPIPGGLESIIGPTDDRVRIVDTDLYPWRMVCALRMRGDSGTSAIGTGWLAGPKTLITAGHCGYSSVFFNGWASSIEISPGRNGKEFPFGTVTSSRFSTVDIWRNEEAPDFDIGCIHLDQPLGDKLGWFALGALTPDELEGYFVNVSGYPSDRGHGTEQYHHKNRILNVTERRVFYDVDTFGGQSGAPVWIHEHETAPPLVIGIHAYGVGGSTAGLEANSAPRIIPEVWSQIQDWVEADGV